SASLLRFLLPCLRPGSAMSFPYPTLFRSVHALEALEPRDIRLVDRLGSGDRGALLREHAAYRGLDVLRADRVEARQAGRLEERRSEEHTSELQSRENLVCRLLL